MDRVSSGCGTWAVASAFWRTERSRNASAAVGEHLHHGHQHQTRDPGLRSCDVVGDAETCHSRASTMLCVEAESDAGADSANPQECRENPGFDDDRVGIVTKHS